MPWQCLRPKVPAPAPYRFGKSTNVCSIAGKGFSMSATSPLIAILVIGIGLAFVFGSVAHRLRMSPIAVYLLAGVFVGPFTPGVLAYQTLPPQLAVVVVLLLMFGVGLHFSLKHFLAVRSIVFPGAL